MPAILNNPKLFQQRRFSKVMIHQVYWWSYFFVTGRRQPCKVVMLYGYVRGWSDGIQETYYGDTKFLGRRNDLSSLKLSTGCCAILFKSTFYKGESRRICKNVTSEELGKAWKVASMKILRHNRGKIKILPLSCWWNSKKIKMILHSTYKQWMSLSWEKLRILWY